MTNHLPHNPMEAVTDPEYATEVGVAWLEFDEAAEGELLDALFAALLARQEYNDACADPSQRLPMPPSYADDFVRKHVTLRFGLTRQQYDASDFAQVGTGHEVAFEGFAFNQDIIAAVVRVIEIGNKRYIDTSTTDARGLYSANAHPHASLFGNVAPVASNAMLAGEHEFLPIVNAAGQPESLIIGGSVAFIKAKDFDAQGIK